LAPKSIFIFQIWQTTVQIANYAKCDISQLSAAFFAFNVKIFEIQAFYLTVATHYFKIGNDNMHYWTISKAFCHFIIVECKSRNAWDEMNATLYLHQAVKQGFRVEAKFMLLWLQDLVYVQLRFSTLSNAKIATLTFDSLQKFISDQDDIIHKSGWMCVRSRLTECSSRITASLYTWIICYFKNRDSESSTFSILTYYNV